MAEGVIPALSELIALRAQVTGRRPARRGSHGLQGFAQSHLRGRGMVYAESREYAIGDDARHIDWRLTARSGKAHTKLHQAERERLTLLVADCAPTLYFGTRVRFKSVQAARVGALAAWLAVQDGDRIAAMRGMLQDSTVAPGAGVRGALRVLEALSRWYARPPEAGPGLAMALEQSRLLLRPGARLLVLADPDSVSTIPASLWSALTRHHEVVVVLLTDPLEQRPPTARLTFQIALPAGADTRIALGLDEAGVRQRWKQMFHDRAEQTVAELHRHGARAMCLSTDAPSDAWLPLLQQASARRRQ
ncbi:MAG: DUF58 domain-containing protein [Xanthomonadaceae bacterium]|nr:DUF58 domain-containing protein [Xanthomonadaceae bacterium]